jgi:hypothetical protein
MTEDIFTTEKKWVIEISHIDGEISKQEKTLTPLMVDIEAGRLKKLDYASKIVMRSDGIFIKVK